MFHFLHTYIPNPVLLNLGSLRVTWYGFLMVLGGIVALLLVIRLAQQYKVASNTILDLAIYWLIGGVVGARIYYVLYAWPMYQGHWLDSLKIWQGGLAVHGVMLGIFVATLIYCRVKKLNFWRLADLLVTGLVTAQIIGRNGNYFNQEIFGRPTDLAWGIPIDWAHRPVEFSSFNYFHPTFLYEVLGSIVILGISLWLHWRRRKKNWRPGNIFLLYLVLYSVMRFSLEFYRLDYSPIVGGIRWAQIISVLLILVSLGLWLWRRKAKLQKINN